MRHRWILVALALLLTGTARAQSTPTFSTQTFAVNAGAISLPGNKSTTAGALTGMTMQVTPNFNLRQTDFVGASGSGLTAYFGGADYTIAPFSTWLNNISPNLNGYNFQLQVTGSAGVDSTSTGEHYAFLGGGRLNYKIASSSTWGLAIDVEYAKLPGYKNNTVIVAVGPTIHF